MKDYTLPEDFDWEFYLNNYSDLINAGLKSEKEAKRHYLNHGISENRVYKKELKEGKLIIKDEKLWVNFINICKDLIPYLPNDFPIINKNSNKKSLIVECRELKHNEFVIKNTIHKLGDGWGHIIYCHKNNYNQIKSICDSISDQIEIKLLDKDLDRNGYNNLLLDLNFWNGIDCEKVLIYQTDTFILNDFDDSFLEYDYVGAPWYIEHAAHIKKNLKIKDDIIIGNGGLSLRSLDNIRENLGSKLNLDLMNNKDLDTSLDKIPEDLYFSILNAGNKLPSFQRSLDFSNEIDFIPSSFGLHKPWKLKGYLDLELELKKSFFQKKKKRILFISHEESRTGAPILLKALIDYEVEKGEFDVWCITLRKGNEDWKYPQNIYYDEIRGKTDFDKAEWIQEVLNPNIVYANTIISVDFAKFFNCYKIVSIHENRSLIPETKYLYEKLSSFDKILVGCNAAKERLNSVDIECEVTPYYLDFKEFNLKKLGEHGNYIVSSAYVQLRKGVHRFIEIAKSMPHKKFKWIGSTEGVEIRDNKITITGNNFLLSEFDSNDPIRVVKLTLDIPSNVEFLGIKTREENNNIIYNSECFLMLSSDDTFPLVTIDAKIFGIPIVTLKESGDSYTICDEKDLVLEGYDKEKIINYIDGLEKNKTTRNVSYNLIEYFRENISINRNYYSGVLNKKIKVFLPISSYSSDFSYDLLKKSIVSLQKFDYDIKIITDRIDDYLIEVVNGELEIIEVKSKIISHIEKTFENYKQVGGAYLMFEIPKICIEKNYEDKFVLYCDYDIICNKDFSNLLPCNIKYLAACPEWEKNNTNYFNTGVIWINPKNMLEMYNECENQILLNLNIEMHDQSILNSVLGNKWSKLDLRMNWKPYWGINNDSYILHYHWLKPDVSLDDMSLKEKINNIGERIIDLESTGYYFEFWKNLENGFR